MGAFHGFRRWRDRPRSVPRALLLVGFLLVGLAAALNLAAATGMPMSMAMLLGCGSILAGAVSCGALSSQLAGARAAAVQNGLLSQIERAGTGKRRAALYDETTGLYQRWYFDLRLEEEYLRAKRYSHSMVIIVLKIGALRLDMLSMDEWGRFAADLGHITANSVRAFDLVGVLGPMEFAIALGQCGRGGGEAAVRRILEELGKSVSTIGMAVFPDDNCDSRTLLELARGRSRHASLYEPQSRVVESAG